MPVRSASAMASIVECASVASAANASTSSASTNSAISIVKITGTVAGAMPRGMRAANEL